MGSYDTLTNCVIADNTAEDTGGGIYARVSRSVLRGCTITGNTASGIGGGGGVYCQQSAHMTMRECIIAGNTATDWEGGALVCREQSSPKLYRCTIASNTALRGEGGAVYCIEQSSPQFFQCLIVANSTPIRYGGALYCTGESSPQFTNCTIAQNIARTRGGSMYCTSSSSPVLCNCILWGNVPPEPYFSTNCLPVITYTHIEGGWPGEGNQDFDPLFADADGPDDDPSTWEDNDYHLTIWSSCVDAGDSRAIRLDTFDLDGDGCTTEREPLDLDGNYRFIDAATPDYGMPTFWYPPVDCGVYEYVSSPDVPAGMCFGDMDCTGVVDNFDIDPFVLALMSANDDPPYADYYAAYPTCNPLHADVDENGVLNLFDINPFIELLTEP